MSIGIVAVLAAVSLPFVVRALTDNGESSPDPAASLTCPAATTDDDPRADVGPSVVRGAVAVRVCGVAGGITAPTAILRDGADEIARQILDLPVTFEASDMICSSYFARNRPRRAFVFAYSDGIVRNALLDSCEGSGFRVGDETRGTYVDVRNVLANFSALVHEQDHPGSQAPVPVTLRCADRPRATVTSVPDLVEGVLCVTVHQPIRRNLVEVAVPAADLAVLVTEARDRVDRFGSVGRRCRGAGPDFVIVARDARGVTYRLDTCGSYPTAQGPVRSSPSARSQAILDRLARQVLK